MTKDEQFANLVANSSPEPAIDRGYAYHLLALLRDNGIELYRPGECHIGPPRCPCRPDLPTYHETAAARGSWRDAIGILPLQRCDPLPEDVIRQGRED